MPRARRPNSYITAALKRRFAMAKVALASADLFADQERISTEMARLGAVVRMFDPAADLTPSSLSVLTRPTGATGPDRRLIASARRKSR
jgi:hypothetical protein